MQKKVVKLLSALLLVCMLTAMLSACTKKDAVNEGTASEQPASQPATESASAHPKLEPVTLNIMLWGDKPNDMDEVVAEFERQTKDTLNIKLNYSFTPQADYASKLKLKLAGGEQVDLAFDAPWMSLNQFIAQDNYIVLDSYFNNDKYPGLKKAFSGDYLTKNMFVGPDNQQHVYGVPLGQYYSDLTVLYYRKDLLKKYGMSDLQSLDDVTKYYDQVLANDKGILPLIERNDGGYGAAHLIDADKGDELDYVKTGVYGIPLGPNVVGKVYVKDNKVVDAIVPETNAPSAAFPALFNQVNTYVKVRQYMEKGYTEKEPITRKDARALFIAGKAASWMETMQNYTAAQSDLQAAVPGAEMGVYLVSKGQREMRQPYATTDFRVWNFLAVPKSSNNQERVMMFLDWLFASQDNHDLFELGIPGKHWEPVGTDKYKLPDGLDPKLSYNLPGYLFTWNPNYIRQPASIPDEFIQYYKHIADQNSYMINPIAGFAFNGEPVKQELANPDFAKISSEWLVLKLGMKSDPDGEISKLRAKWENNKKLTEDIEKIKAEFIKQLQKYLDSK